MKLYLSLLFLVVSFISCNEKQEKESPDKLKTEVRIIELNDQLQDIEMTKTALKASAYSERVLDSLSIKKIKTQNLIDSIMNSSGIDLKQAELNCITGFGLEVKQLNSKKRNYLKLLYGYEICGPGWIACGFAYDTTENMKSRRQLIIKEANKNYKNYIRDILKGSYKKAYPDISEKDFNTFNIIAKTYLKQDFFDKPFKDSACSIAQEDSIFNQLYAETLNASMKEL